MNIVNVSVLVFALSLLALWLAAQTGSFFGGRRRNLEEAEREDLGVILAAALTLLGLIIGFSFSMAVNRYDQRKQYEAEEANAIGTEYVRAGLLRTGDATKVRELLRSYLDQRISFYTRHDARQLEQIIDPQQSFEVETYFRPTAEPSMVRCSGSRRRTAHTCGRPGRFRHERCVELAGIHRGGLEEPHPDCGVGADGGGRYLL